MTYINVHKTKFEFGDHVYADCVFTDTPEERSGRLVQVRKGTGQFHSDIYLIRSRTGRLLHFENIMLRHIKENEVELQDMLEQDTETTEYTLSDGYPETGFLIENPSNPMTFGSFMITRG